MVILMVVISLVWLRSQHKTPETGKRFNKNLPSDAACGRRAAAPTLARAKRKFFRRRAGRPRPRHDVERPVRRAGASSTRRNCAAGKSFAEVREAFWKQEPQIKKVLAEISAPRVFIVPLFISEGYFSTEVIPTGTGLQLSRQLKTQNSKLRTVLLPSGRLARFDDEGDSRPRGGSRGTISVSARAQAGGHDAVHRRPRHGAQRQFPQGRSSGRWN